MTQKRIQPIDAAGGVLYKTQKNEGNGRGRSQGDYDVLLIYRRGTWDLPKGKCEESESYEHCAVREVKEETGAPSPVLRELLLDTYHEYPEGNRIMGKTTRWYAMETSDPAFKPVPQLEEDIEQVKWFSLTEAVEKVGFENLKDVLNEFEDKVAGR